MTNVKVTLTEEKETLLVTLYAKAEDSRVPDSMLHDRFAAEAVGKIDYDFSKVRMGRASEMVIALRAKVMDDWTRKFMAAHPDAVVLHLGCGLDSRVFRLDPPPGVLWFDVDYPEVIDLRRRLYPDRAGYTLIASSVTAEDWLSQVPADRPAMIIAEGLLLYVPEEEVARLLERLVNYLPNGEVVFDNYSSLGLWMIRNTPSIKATGASVHWGIDDPHELERQVPMLKFVEEYNFSDSAEFANMSWMAQATVRFVHAVPSLRKLGRFFRYRF
jgi:O-methyltransferase involved in polyketide biosynthesis